MGATPEKLLESKDNKVHTMALAGTQLFDELHSNNWTEKEYNEQAIVTDYLIEKLETITSQVAVSKPYDSKAGNLIHLKTDIVAQLNKDQNLSDTIAVLHPTPAVCGFPKKEAKQFILENENYEREFYAGFLGELNKDFNSGENNTDLFVNLRCIKIENNLINFYAGGGITKDSIPEIEWDETVNKTNTIKSCIL